MIIDFSHYSPIKIGPVVEVKEITPTNYQGEFIIGGATNTLISPTPPPLGILSSQFRFIYLDKGVLRVGGATPNRHLYNFAREHDLGGFEFLAQIPGTIGGTIRMNGGIKGYEIGNRVIAVQGVDGWTEKEKLGFRYRDSSIDFPIFEAILNWEGKFNWKLDERLKELRKNQPKGPSLGSVFKNPPGDFAGRLIEKAGLKGYQIGGIMVSPVHGNFFINVGNGTFEDMVALIKLVQRRVFNRFGVQLIPEIKIL